MFYLATTRLKSEKNNEKGTVLKGVNENTEQLKDRRIRSRSNKRNKGNNVRVFFDFTVHYENTPIQIYRKFHLQKLKIFRYKNSDIFHISAQNIDCGYSLEPPRRGGSNEYPQSMFLSRNKKNNVYPCKPQFYYIKVG